MPVRIDSHQHFWDLAKFPYPWMPPSPNVLRRNYLPADLKPVLDANRFDGCVTVQATMHPGEATWMLELADANPFIKGVVGWVDLTGADLPKTLDGLQRHPKFRGVRHPVHDEPDANWLLRADVVQGLKELERRDIPYDLLLKPPHLPVVPKLVERVPELRMVVDHIAKPLIAQKTMEPWARDIAALAKLPTIWVKLSGMITEADRNSWRPPDLAPYLHHVYQLFGPDRLMFGSDWPVCLLAGSWKQVLAAFTQCVGPLKQDARDKLLGGTAAKFYGLKE